MDVWTEDFEPLEVPFRLKGRSFVLVEASGSAWDAHRARVRAQTIKKMDDGTIAEIDSKGLSAALVADCCFEVKKGVREAVPVTETNGWPQRALTAYFDKILEISGITQPPKTPRDELELVAKYHSEREGDTHTAALIVVQEEIRMLTTIIDEEEDPAKND